MAWWHSALHMNLIVDSCFSRYRVAKVQWLQDVILAPGSPEQKEVCAVCLLFNFLLNSFTCFACIWTTSGMCICSFFTRVYVICLCPVGPSTAAIFTCVLICALFGTFIYNFFTKVYVNYLCPPGWSLVSVSLWLEFTVYLVYCFNMVTWSSLLQLWSLGCYLWIHIEDGNNLIALVTAVKSYNWNPDMSLQHSFHMSMFNWLLLNPTQ
jgi:hypothetical protein